MQHFTRFLLAVGLAYQLTAKHNNGIGSDEKLVAGHIIGMRLEPGEIFGHFIYWQCRRIALFDAFYYLDPKTQSKPFKQLSPAW